MHTRRASLVSSVKTRSCQDMFHDACFCLTPHHKTSRPPPKRLPSTMSLSSVIEFVAPAPVVSYAAPAPVIECSAL